MNDVLKLTFDEFGGRVAENFSELFVDAKVMSVEAEVGDTDCGQFEGGGVEFFAVAQSLFQRGITLKNLFRVGREGGTMSAGDGRIEERLMSTDCFQGCDQIAGDGGF